MLNGERLRQLRISRGLSQEALGSVLGVTKASVCCYEKGTRTPTLETLMDLVLFFGVSADFLLGNDKMIVLEDTKEREMYMTKFEVVFIKELRKNKYLSEVLLEDAKRSMELLNKKIG